MAKRCPKFSKVSRKQEGKLFHEMDKSCPKFSKVSRKQWSYSNKWPKAVQNCSVKCLLKK